MSTYIEIGKILLEIFTGLYKDFKEDLDKNVEDGSPEAQAMLDKWRDRRQSAVQAWRDREQD